MKTRTRNRQALCSRQGRMPFSSGGHWLPGLLAVFTMLGSTATGAVIVQEFFMPLPEAQVYEVFNKHAPYGPPNVIMDSVFSIIVTTPNTVVYLDHWEDGYESDLNTPTNIWSGANEVGTQIWGDGNDANGICPGYTNDPSGLSEGTIITLDNRPGGIPIPYVPGVYYDGGDRIGATKAITVSRGAYETFQRFTAQTVFVEVPSTIDHGLNYISPVGTNVAARGMFANADMMIMADEDSTQVVIDRDGPGPIASYTTNISRGATGALLVEDISKGATVQADKPVQTHIITGRFTGQFETRSFVLRPAELWHNKYLIPVGTADTNYPGVVFLFNTNAAPLDITYTDTGGTGILAIPGGNGLLPHPLPLNSGTLLESMNGTPFFAICTMNAGPDEFSGAGADFDWGFTPVPFEGLTTEAVVGWGRGAVTNGVVGATGTENGSPVWITAPSNTTLYVDYFGDSQGPLTDPNGGGYDTNYVVSALEATAIYNPTVPDQTGMRIYTLDETVIAGAWGEDASTAEPGPPYLDMGHALVPFPVVSITKTSELVTDLDTEPLGVLNVGDTLEYTLRVSNQGLLPLGNLVVFDTFALQLFYVNNSTTFNGSPLADDFDPFGFETPFPLDPGVLAPGGFTIPTLERDGIAEFVYRAKIVSPGDILNVGSAEEGPTEISVTNVVTAVSTVSIGNVAVLEGDSGTTDLAFAVSLSDRKTDEAISVDFYTSNGTALAGIDYIATNGTLTIPAGETNVSLIIKGIGETELELDETLFVTLTNATGGVLTGDSLGEGTIINDDSRYTYNIEWTYNPRRDSWFGTLTVSNDVLSADAYSTDFRYSFQSNSWHYLRFPDGSEPDAGINTASNWYYVDLSAEAGISVLSIGNQDAVLDPGESAVFGTNIELWGRGAVEYFGTRAVSEFVLFGPVDPQADPVAEPLADWDGDGVSNAEESIAGTNPSDQSSVFTIHVEPGDGFNRLVWEGREGRVYTVLSSPNLATPFSVLADGIPGTEPWTVFIHTNIPSGEAIFYKGEVHLQ